MSAGLRALLVAGLRVLNSLTSTPTGSDTEAIAAFVYTSVGDVVNRCAP